jgi:hypothetical protein
VINKIDLLPHVDFSRDRFLANLDRVNPGAESLEVGARSGCTDAFRRQDGSCVEATSGERPGDDRVGIPDLAGVKQRIS